MLEKPIQNAILDWLSWQKDLVYWINDSVGIWDEAKKIYRQRKSKHHRKGVSDILVCSKGQLIAIEVKSPTGRLSPHQKAFFADITRVGGKVLCARSVEDVIRQFKYWELV